MSTDQQNHPATPSTQRDKDPRCGDSRKSNGGPKNSLKKRNGATARVYGKKGCRQRSHNALYQLAAAFKGHHPKAAAAEAWKHFCTVTEISAHDVVLAHDSAADTLTYRPDPGRFDTRTIKQDSFARRWREIV